MKGDGGQANKRPMLGEVARPLRFPNRKEEHASWGGLKRYKGQETSARKKGRDS